MRESDSGTGSVLVPYINRFFGENQKMKNLAQLENFFSSRAMVVKLARESKISVRNGTRDSKKSCDIERIYPDNALASKLLKFLGSSRKCFSEANVSALIDLGFTVILDGENISEIDLDTEYTETSFDLDVNDIF